MIGNAFGAWPWIFVAGITLAAVAIGIPLAILAVLARVERAGSWAVEGIHRIARRGTSASDHRPDTKVLSGGDELPVR